MKTKYLCLFINDYQISIYKLKNIYKFIIYICIDYGWYRSNTLNWGEFVNTYVINWLYTHARYAYMHPCTQVHIYAYIPCILFLYIHIYNTVTYPYHASHSLYIYLYTHIYKYITGAHHCVVISCIFVSLLLLLLLFLLHFLLHLSLNSQIKSFIVLCSSQR